MYGTPITELESLWQEAKGVKDRDPRFNPDERNPRAITLRKGRFGALTKPNYPSSFTVAVKVGGQAFGAYADRSSVAFLLAIPGLKPGESTSTATCWAF